MEIWIFEESIMEPLHSKYHTNQVSSACQREKNVISFNQYLLRLKNKLNKESTSWPTLCVAGFTTINPV